MLELFNLLHSLHLDLNLLFDVCPVKHILPIQHNLVLVSHLILDLLVKQLRLDRLHMLFTGLYGVTEITVIHHIHLVISFHLLLVQQFLGLR